MVVSEPTMGMTTSSVAVVIVPVPSSKAISCGWPVTLRTV